MTAQQVLDTLAFLGVRVVLKDGQPRLTGNTAQVSQELLQEIRACRQQILERLQDGSAPTGPPPPSRTLPRTFEFRWQDGSVNSYSHPGRSPGPIQWRYAGETDADWKTIPRRGLDGR